MSKIGEKPIVIPSSVSVLIKEKELTVKGKDGQMTIKLPETLSAKLENNILTIKRQSDIKKIKSWHGLFRTLINNAVIGVEKPWQKRLEIVGTGFNVKLQGEDLVFKVGYSHPVVFKKAAGIKYQTEGNNKVIVSGVDKQLVGEVTYQIKIIRKPDPYKGKGIKYEGEKLRIKPGKKVKAVAGAGAA